jgi:hypothetical protein
MKMNIKSLLTFLLICILSSPVFSQKFLNPSFTFSHKHESYITLKNGEKLTGTLDKLRRKKGLLESVVFVDTENKTHKLSASDIAHMYLMPSGFDKFSAGMEFLSDATMWEDNDLEKDVIGKGYVYFEQSEVLVGKKKQVLLLQLLNPSYSNKIKVYHDPYAQETASAGVGGITMVGGDAKSYYVSKGGKTAIRLKKKNYRDLIPEFYGDCPDFVEKLGKTPRWSEFEKQVYDYSTSCSN